LWSASYHVGGSQPLHLISVVKSSVGVEHRRRDKEKNN
jgi:hypothetical protein